MFQINRPNVSDMCSGIVHTHVNLGSLSREAGRGSILWLADSLQHLSRPTVPAQHSLSVVLLFTGDDSVPRRIKGRQPECCVEIQLVGKNQERFSTATLRLNIKFLGHQITVAAEEDVT